MAHRSFATAAHREAPLAFNWFDTVHCAWPSSTDDQMMALPSRTTKFSATDLRSRSESHEALLARTGRCYTLSAQDQIARAVRDQQSEIQRARIVPHRLIFDNLRDLERAAQSHCARR
jgi:hypothetical protein